MKLSRIMGAIVALALSVHAWAQTKYYIDGDNGSDSNNGTSSTTAWKTLTKWKTAVLDDVGLLSRSGDTVVMAGNIYEPVGVLADFSSYSAPNKGGVTFRQWIPADGYPSGGSALAPGIAKAVIWGAQPLTNIVSGGWSTAGAAGRRQITLTASTDIKTLVWRYGQNRDAAGRLYGHFYKCSAVGSGAAADGVYDSSTNASGKLDGFYQTGTTLTIDSTFVGTPTTADFVAAYDLTIHPLTLLRANGCLVKGLEFRLALQRTSGAYALCFDSCTNTWGEDCVAYDAGHHAFGISNQDSVARSDSGFRRCVAMGLFGVNGSSTNSRGGFSVSITTDATLGGQTIIEDSEAHVYTPLSPQLRTDGSQLAYPAFRSSGDYSGTPTRFACAVATGFPTTGGTPAYNVSGLLFRNCLFRMYRDTIGVSVAENGVVYGSNSSANKGNGQVGDPASAETYPIRFQDCTFVDVGRMMSGAILNTSFQRCRFLMTQVQYNNQAAVSNSSGAIQVENFTDASRTWYQMFDSCDFVTSLNTTADNEAFFMWTNGSATKNSLRFQNCRILIHNQRRPASAQDQSIFFLNQSGGTSGATLTVRGCIVGWFEPAKTNATHRLMRSDGTDLGTKLTFSGNIYRNITAGKWSYGNSGYDTVAEWLNRSTGIDPTGVLDIGPDGPAPLSWGGPLAGYTNPLSGAALGLVPGGYPTSGFGGRVTTGAIGPYQFGPVNPNPRGRGR